MVVAVDEVPWIKIDPERDRVRVRCAGELAGRVAAQLGHDCEGLIDRGFTRLILDLSRTTAIAPSAVTAIAVVDHRARTMGCRLSIVVPGNPSAAAALRRAGLLGQLHLDGADETFLDWSR